MTSKQIFFFKKFNKSPFIQFKTPDKNDLSPQKSVSPGEINVEPNIYLGVSPNTINNGLSPYTSETKYDIPNIKRKIEYSDKQKKKVKHEKPQKPLLDATINFDCKRNEWQSFSKKYPNKIKK